jgi:hypothetical protein
MTNVYIRAAKNIYLEVEIEMSAIITKCNDNEYLLSDWLESIKSETIQHNKRYYSLETEKSPLYKYQ